MDLEWNRGYDKTPLDEILQIGAVKLAQPGGPILDTIDLYVKPRIHKKFDHGAKRLPELDRSKASEMKFKEAWQLFRVWCGEETEFASWGGQDLDALKKSCVFWGVDYDLPEQGKDLQAVMGRIFGVSGQQIALWRVMAYMGVPDIYDYHNALNDSVYTALATRLMTREDIDFVPPPKEKQPRRRRPRLTVKSFTPRPAAMTGPFEAREAALDARPSRSPQCPLCERHIWVTEWRSAPESEEHWGMARCPEHGRFLCRLELKPGEAGWRGELSVPQPDEAVLAAYTGAGRLYRCRTGSGGAERPHRKRSRRKRGKRRTKNQASGE